MVQLVFALVVFLLFIWRIKKGFANGIMKEIVTILSGIVSLVSVVLLFFAVTSVMAKAMSTLTLSVLGLIVVGIVFKISSLIFKPILALGNFSVIEGVNKMLGAVMGAAEACILGGLLYYGLGYMGIYVF